MEHILTMGHWCARKLCTPASYTNAKAGPWRRAFFLTLTCRQKWFPVSALALRIIDLVITRNLQVLLLSKSKILKRGPLFNGLQKIISVTTYFVEKSCI
jgi:hypothetical protein